MDPEAHGDRPRRSRAREPELSADERDLAAEDRDLVSQTRDKASEGRDQNADARDLRAEHREQTTSPVEVAAQADRGGAWRDRLAGAEDRHHAADDRTAASRDRTRSARDRRVSSVDGLTGAHRRDAGLVELGREAARARRTHTSLVVAFVDVDGLKVTNDTLGHAAGDELLTRVVGSIRAHLRPYDLITRVGGDEFVCSSLDLTAAQVAERFALISAELAEAHASITAGIAELEPDESPDDLIARADAALRALRRQQQPPTAPA